MANEQNLIPLNKRTERERKEISRKGAIASNKKQAEKKTLRELLEIALNEGTKTDNDYVNITRALIKEASNGNVKAYETIRDTLGQKPKEELKIEQAKPFKVKIEVVK